MNNTNLILNLFKRDTNICEIVSDRWMHYPTDVLVENKPLEIIYENHKPYDRTRRLEHNLVFNVLSLLLKKRIGSVGMFLNSYFYDPVYGYCTCNAVINQYNNNLNVEDDFSCNCSVDIIRFRKPPPPPYKIIEDLDYIRKVEFFPEGFVEILKTDLVYFGKTPVYLISSLNVMDVKQTSKNIFEVGIVIHVLNYYMDGWDVIQTGAYWHKEVDWCNYVNDFSKDYYKQNFEYYHLKCMPIIENWLEKGLILKDELFVHLFTLNERELILLDEDYELRTFKFEGLHEDRMYIRQKDFHLVKKGY